MKTKILLLTILTTGLVGCDKQPEPKPTKSEIQSQYDVADQKIEKFLDVLDDPNADKEQQTKILCEDYPKVYELDYMPALLKISPQDYTKEKLLSDFKVASDYYKEKLGIKCS
ncbi:hypothetical protein [Acinetobacter beijerinckii]|uniref:hypothetical protein n=1 Tax=Acinetobacter beijerinckii TaxID=262668 RepID=UPI0005F0370D|nr:hypothetical protein [Acinetobacter beijerinckii]